jgi:hypothetical protein
MGLAVRLLALVGALLGALFLLDRPARARRFDYVSNVQTLTLPADGRKYVISITAVGAEGGGSPEPCRDCSGGYVSASFPLRLPTHQKNKLLIYVGEEGFPPNSGLYQTPGGTTFDYGKGGVPGGEVCGTTYCFGAGGQGGYVSVAPPGKPQPESGSGGGAGSFVFLERPSGTKLLVVAPGGGGDGGSSQYNSASGAGSARGGNGGSGDGDSPGLDGQGTVGYDLGGIGGSQATTKPGEGGVPGHGGMGGGVGESQSNSSCYAAQNGGNGGPFSANPFKGGIGGYGSSGISQTSSPQTGGGGGGGGGGGYAGGGAGGGGGLCIFPDGLDPYGNRIFRTYAGGGGGGGGGSGFVAADAQGELQFTPAPGSLHGPGINNGDGFVRISVDPYWLGTLSLNPASFAPSGRGGSIARACAKGTTVRYQDAVKARTTFTVLRLSGGRLSEIGRFVRNDRKGRNTFRFTGRLKGHALSPGSYELEAIGRYHRAHGNTAIARFEIVHC